nr:phage portal protein [Ehrlichia chaffeensis]
MEGILTYKLISGNAYILTIENHDMIPKELHLLRPDRIEITPGKDNRPYSYRYSINNYHYDYKINKSTIS